MVSGTIYIYIYNSDYVYICDQNYITTDVTIPSVIYVTFPMILLFKSQLRKIYIIKTGSYITDNIQLYLFIQPNSSLQCEWED